MKKSGIFQFIKFGIVGVSNTAVDWIVYFLLNSFVLQGTGGELISKAISFIVAALNSFTWNSLWTFKKEYKQATKKADDVAQKTGSLFLKFLVISLIGWAINYYVFKYARIDMEQSKIISLVLASGAATLWNFLVTNFGPTNNLIQFKKCQNLP